MVTHNRWHWITKAHVSILVLPASTMGARRYHNMRVNLLIGQIESVYVKHMHAYTTMLHYS